MVDKAEILGTWRLVSAQVHMEQDGRALDVHGQNPLGCVIFEPSGRMMAIVTNSSRAPPTNDAESAALYRGMTAYSGRYSIQENTVVTRLDVAWHPDWEKSEQTRFVELSGDKLVLSTPVQEHPSFPGQMHRGVFTWVRERT
jgi:Lipocalin-like domain